MRVETVEYWSLEIPSHELHPRLKLHADPQINVSMTRMALFEMIVAYGIPVLYQIL